MGIYSKVANITCLSLERKVINMPNKNGTGPEGKGPKTGRGQGPCVSTGSANAGNGVQRGEVRGRGRGMGRGLGLGKNVDNEKN